MTSPSDREREKESVSVRAMPPPLPWAPRRPSSAAPKSFATGRRPPRAVPPPLPLARKPEKAKLLSLDPAELDPFKNLLLFAKTTVEGWFAGRHRSVDYGASGEFAEYRRYAPGDPVAHIDWRVYARSRRLVVRSHREERDLTGYLVVDVSGSMGYAAAGRESKQLRAARIAASLAYLMAAQGDKFSLALFQDTLRGHLPPGSTRRHLHDLVAMLEERLASPSGRTSAHEALDLCVPLFRRRGCLVVVSDFFTDLDRFFDAVARFQHRRFEVLLLHVVDPDERDLPDVALASFVDMETGAEVQAAPDEIREAYRREMEAMTARIETEALRRGFHYQLLRTERPYLEAIEAWLGARSRLAGGGGR
jgi:uncharacterized protein (DUF58 family)